MNTFSIRPKGQVLVQYIRCLMLARGNVHQAINSAVAQFGEDSDVAMCARAAASHATKAAVPGGGTVGWSGELTHYAIAANDFLEYVAPRTIIGKLANLRRVPVAVRVPAATSAASAGWIGEGKGIAVSALAFESLTLETKKCAALVVLSDEIATASQPEAEAIIRTDLARALIRLSDETFVSNSAATSLAPAGIAYGAPSISSTGNATEDLKRLVDIAEGNLDEMVFAMSPGTAMSLSGADRPDCGARGGSVGTIPVITSAAFADGSAGGRILLIDATRVAFADDGLTIAVSREGTIQLSDAPTQDALTPTASTLTSLFQCDAIALRATRQMNWMTTSGACAALVGTNY